MHKITRQNFVALDNTKTAKSAQLKALASESQEASPDPGRPINASNWPLKHNAPSAEAITAAHSKE